MSSSPYPIILKFRIGSFHCYMCYSADISREIGVFVLSYLIISQVVTACVIWLTITTRSTVICATPVCLPTLTPQTVYPLLQIRQAMALLGSGTTGTGGGASGAGKTGQQGMTSSDSICVAACFAKSRGWVMGSPNMSREKHGKSARLYLWQLLKY